MLYLNWLHGTYLPALLTRPGYLWAAHYAAREREGGAATQIHHTTDPKVGTGYHYILLVGATDADVFGNPTPSAINAALPETGRKMVAMRVGERVNIDDGDGPLRRPSRHQGRHGRSAVHPNRQLQLSGRVRGRTMHAGYVASACRRTARPRRASAPAS